MGSRSFLCLYSLDPRVPNLSFPGEEAGPRPRSGVASSYSLLFQRASQEAKSSLVLMALTRAPFKPLQLAAPKYLAWKVFFLTLLASGARRGELNVITAKGVQHEDKWQSFSSFPHPSFISRTQLRAKGA